jgi:hypothetical protein
MTVCFNWRMPSALALKQPLPPRKRNPAARTDAAKQQKGLLEDQHQIQQIACLMACTHDSIYVADIERAFFFLTRQSPLPPALCSRAIP